ncbi:MAG TPA: polysaccharide biosynthesis/export family protein [Sphingobium sp.]|nr:polysaccharide biosynthesis/export family protein [Sphingobium sp.]
MRSKHLIVGLCGLLAACAGGGLDLPLLASAGPATYHLGANDEIRVWVFGFDAINNSYMVGDGGVVSLPFVGSVSVAGRSTTDLEQSIAAHLIERDLARHPQVSVQITKYRPFYISGEVQKPGQYPYVPGLTMEQAVSMAGGYTFRARQDDAMVTRKEGGRTIRGRARAETALRPDDSIVVPEAWF